MGVWILGKLKIIVMFGNSGNCGVGSGNWETAVKLLDEYMRECEKRNPILKVFNSVVLFCFAK